MNREYLRKCASIAGISYASLVSGLEARELILPPTDVVEAHRPELVKPDGSPLFDASGIIKSMIPGAMGAAMAHGQGGSSFNIADYFNTTVFTGNATARSIVTGIDLAANPGMVIFGINDTTNPLIWDTLRGTTKVQQAGSSAADLTLATGLTAFNSNGFSLGGDTPNTSGVLSAAWTWRKHPKLFNLVTYSGNGASSRSVAHGLSVAPGMVIVKRLQAGSQGAVWHKGLTAGGYEIDWTSGVQALDPSNFGDSTIGINPDATNVYIGNASAVNNAASTYVMYVFADDPTGYIASGNYAGNGSTTGPIVNLGWEPQWLLLKRRDVSGGAFYALDNVRGFTVVKPWSAGAYFSFSPMITTSSTGFQIVTDDNSINHPSSAFLYTAIRKP